MNISDSEQTAPYDQAAVAADPLKLFKLLEQLQEPGLVQAIPALDDETLRNLVEELHGWVDAAHFVLYMRSSQSHTTFTGVRHG